MTPQPTIPPRRSGPQDLTWLREELSFERSQSIRDQVRIDAISLAIHDLLNRPAAEATTNMSAAELQRAVSQKSAR